MVQLSGEAVTDEDGIDWISRSGSDEKVCLLEDGTESIEQLSIREPIDWVGSSMEEFGMESTARFCIDVR